MCSPEPDFPVVQKSEISPGAHSVEKYLPLIKGKRVGLVVNHTSTIGKKHIVDSLLESNINITKIFAPEHGYKGKADAGEHIENGKKNNADIISLYGKKKKPSSEDLNDVDILIFDIQDVGVRFYTYISTLHYVMESAAENKIPIIVLDRPNPNGFYVDGPILDSDYSSFVGMHPVPVVYGLTIGEYATMINGEGWLNQGLKASLTVIKNKNYDHTMIYDLPIKPSPNLPNLRSILLYPSLCYFEGTNVSVGRGTETQFQVVGHPELKDRYSFSYSPISREGAKYPKHENALCYGLDLTQVTTSELKSKRAITMDYLVQIHNDFKEMEQDFFIENNFFDKLAGNSALKTQLTKGLNPQEISNTWQVGLENYKATRSNYLLYPDFE